MTRTQKALFGIDKSMRILEIGPSYSPIAPKADGWDCMIADHASQDDLRTKYTPQGVDIQKIEPVDFIWTGEPIDTVIPVELHGSFDAIILSHVIEHIPDPLSFFEGAEKLLKTGGRISLIVPDKRFIFDRFRPLTTLDSWLEAKEQNAKKHSPKNVFNHHAYTIWYNTKTVGDYCLSDLSKAFELSKTSHNEVYMDIHAWCFTPSSFQLLILEACSLLGINLVIANTFPTRGTEFYVSLKKQSAIPICNTKRLALLKMAFAEQRVDADNLPRRIGHKLNSICRNILVRNSLGMALMRLYRGAR